MKISAMPIRPVHHRGDRESMRWIFGHGSKTLRK
jgi:hypothetical protein